MSRALDDEARRLRLAFLADDVVNCFRCPRLVAWREEAAREKRAAYAEEEYWGRPVPGFGDPGAWLLIVGLAPAAHGANRTGRIFTGDRSGDWLFRALHRADLASQPESVRADDDLTLRGAWVTAAVRCAPPDNRPRPAERRRCRPYLERELDLLRGVRVVVPLGGYAYTHVMRILRDRGAPVPSPMPGFEHGLEVPVGAWRPARAGAGNGGAPPGRGGGTASRDGTTSGDGTASGDGRRGPLTLLVSYHPSQQNTFTGVLTEDAFDRIWERAKELREAGAS